MAEAARHRILRPDPHPDHRTVVDLRFLEPLLPL